MAEVSFNKRVQGALNNDKATEKYEVAPKEYQQLQKDLRTAVSGFFFKGAKYDSIKLYQGMMEEPAQRLAGSLMSGLTYNQYLTHVDNGTMPTVPDNPSQIK